MPFTIKITQCSFKDIWYKQQLNTQHLAVNFQDHFFRIYQTNKIVSKTDCEIIK